MIKVLLPQLSTLLVDEVVEDGAGLIVRARTPPVAVPCPQCDRPSQRVHGYHVRRLADLPAAGRGVVVELRVRRLVCQASGCGRRTFREQIPALAQRWARRTRQLTALIADLAVTLAGRAGAAVLARLGVTVSRTDELVERITALTLRQPGAPSTDQDDRGQTR